MEKFNKFINFVVLISLFCGTLSSQNTMTSLSKATEFTDDTQIKNIIKILTTVYKDNFTYYTELISGAYVIEKTSEGYFINIKKQKSVIDKIKLITIKKSNGFNEVFIDKKESDRLIQNITKGRYSNYLNPSCSEIFTIYTTNYMLWDKEILHGEDYDFGKILNRNICRENLEDDDGEESRLFYNLTDGIVIPFDGGNTAKVLCVDRQWNTVVFIDKGHEELGIQYYGSQGTGNNQFIAPTGIAYGRGVDHGSYFVYPIYIADQVNKRIISVNFIASDADESSGFDKNTFTRLDSIVFPYDIAFFEATSGKDEDDKLWVSQSPIPNPSLACISTYDGTVVQENIRGFQYENNGSYYTVLFAPNSNIRLAVYSGYSYDALCFIDNIHNSIVSCRLTDEGLADSLIYQNGYYIIYAEDHLSFPSEHRLSSIAFQRTTSESDLWTNLWVTSGFSPPLSGTSSMVHGFKMNKMVHTQYLGSSNRPYNTNLSFSNLTNLVSNNGYKDVVTLEKWEDNYGIRRYWYYSDVRCEELYYYCRTGNLNSCIDSNSDMRFKSILTNDCQIKLSPYFQIDTTWVAVEFNKIDGYAYEPDIFTTVIGRPAGYTNTYISLRLPIERLLLGSPLRIDATYYPDYVNPSNWYEQVISKSYYSNIDRNCFLPQKGGCPFLYVQGEDTCWKVDNNILHKAEFSGGVDLTDNYFLRVEPLIDDGKIYMALAENEHDITSLDYVTLFAIDHPEGTKVFITEDNQVAMFYESNVQSTDTANKNGDNITSKIQYGNNNFFVQGIINDSIYAHYPSSILMTSRRKEKVNNSKKITGDVSGIFDSSNAIIIQLKNLDILNPVTYKNWAGQLDAFTSLSTQVTRLFSRREFSSTTIIPVAMTTTAELGYINHVNIDWSSDYAVNYISVAKSVEYNSGFTTTDIRLDNAISYTLTSSEDVTSSLANTDQTYATLDSSRVLKLRFDASKLSEPQSGYVRDYMIECVGHYTAGGDKMIVKSNNQIPIEFRLFQNYPNPFNPTSKIKFSLPKNLKVVIKVYDILGREVKTLINEFRTAGYYEVLFDGTNFASGVYFYRIEAGSFVDAKKMVLIK